MLYNYSTNLLKKKEIAILKGKTAFMPSNTLNRKLITRKETVS